MMTQKQTISATLFLLAAGLCACGNRTEQEHKVSFTRTDSLTEKYLEIHDSMLEAWNIMLSDENQKLRAMHNILHELMFSSQPDQDKLISLEKRLDQFSDFHLTQESIDDQEMIDEYDFATNALVNEVISLAETNASFAHNTTLQKLVDEVKTSDQRVDINRANYDSIVACYNNFLEINKSLVHEIDHNISLEKKPLFQIVSND